MGASLPRPSLPRFYREATMRALRWLTPGGAFLALLLVAGCDNTPPAQAAKKVKVVVTEPISDTVMEYQDFTGRLEAVKTVEIRARVSGYVTEIPFNEGDEVEAGKLLFQIDPRPYQADLNLAEANYKVAVADRKLMESNATRDKQLFAANGISRADYDASMAALEKSGATVGAMEAARERAKLYLDYTRVTAPLAGRISRRFVDPGNLVNADNTMLTTIVTEKPMYAYFDVDERTYLELLATIAPGQKSWIDGLKLPVLMRLANEPDFRKDRVGVVDFVDNRVIATTGTVRMRGVFDNPKGMLKAGLFVRIRLPIGSPYESILIPDEAIQSDQERKYVWIVNNSNEVEYRSVKLGQSIQELRAIKAPDPGKEGKEGLSRGERVIVSGMQRVRKGIQVDATMQPAPAPPGSPLVRLLADSKKPNPPGNLK